MQPLQASKDIPLSLCQNWLSKRGFQVRENDRKREYKIITPEHLEPSQPFLSILEPRSPRIDELYAVLKYGSTDFLGFEIVKGSVGKYEVTESIIYPTGPFTILET